MKKNGQRPLTWAQIDLSSLRHNYKTLKKNGVEILPVIKADAYGHGMIAVAKELDRLGVGIFGVSDLAQGLDLRRNGFHKDILLLESPLPLAAEDIVKHHLTASVCTLESAFALNKQAGIFKEKVKIHIKVDTGMGRLGVWHKEAKEFIRLTASFPNLIIDGIFTHFPLSDKDPRFTRRQIKDFSLLLESLGEMRKTIRYVHAANSMGLCGYQTDIFNLARPGLMLYGLYPHKDLRKKIKLKPVMSVKTRVIFVKALPKGRGVSYGHTYVAKKSMKAATLAIGYSDGYFRCLSNKGAVLIHGKRCPVVGNITMDQIIVDVSFVPNVKAGDVAVILGADKKAMISAEELGALAKTINYEIVCNLGNRLERKYIKTSFLSNIPPE